MQCHSSEVNRTVCLAQKNVSTVILCFDSTEGFNFPMTLIVLSYPYDLSLMFEC